MATGKRASMREGPLAQLFRKTDEESPAEESKREEPKREEQARARTEEHLEGDAQPEGDRQPEGDGQPEGSQHREPRGGRALPIDGPAPQATRHVPGPQAQKPSSEAARRRERRERHAGGPPRTSRYEGVPTPEERLRSVFASDIP